MSSEFSDRRGSGRSGRVSRSVEGGEGPQSLEKNGLLAALMARHEWIVWLGGGVLGYVAGEMMTDDPVVQQWLGPAAKAADLWLSLVLGVFVLALGWWLARTATRRGGEPGHA